jgi:hypothetical protein
MGQTTLVLAQCSLRRQNKVGRISSSCMLLDVLERCTDKSRYEINYRDRWHSSNPRIHCCSRSGHPCSSYWKHQYLKRATSPPSNLFIDAPHAKLFGIAAANCGNASIAPTPPSTHVLYKPRPYQSTSLLSSPKSPPSPANTSSPTLSATT